MGCQSTGLQGTAGDGPALPWSLLRDPTPISPSVSRNRSWFFEKAFNKVLSVGVSLTTPRAALLRYYKSSSVSGSKNEVCRIVEHGTKATQEILEMSQVKRELCGVILY